MPKINFKDIEGREKGKIGFVCATGPSLSPYMESFKKLSRENTDKYAFFGCNEFDSKTGIFPQYWIVANNEFTVNKFHPAINRHEGTVLVYAYSVDKTPPDQVENLINGEYIAYSEREKGIREGDKSIQEFLKEMTGHNEIYGGAGTVAVHMLATAIITGCNPIYVAGVDMDYKKGYCDGTSSGRLGWLSQHQGTINNSFQVLKASAALIGIDIYNLNTDPPYDALESVDLPDFKAEL